MLSVPIGARPQYDARGLCCRVPLRVERISREGCVSMRCIGGERSTPWFIRLF